MGYFENNRLANFEGLEKVIDKDGKRVYSPRLVQGIRNGYYNVLNEINSVDRSDRKFMEPLLYAVKKEKATYIVYKYYGKDIQEDLGLLIEVVIDEPEIIQDTPISYNREYILDVAEINPRVILYMSETLKNDTEFIEELRELEDPNVDAHVALVENPSLASNPEFMKEAIKQDANLLKNVDPSLKNDYKFMKEVTQINYEAVGQVIKNRKDFGLEGIKGAKETTRELTTREYIEIIDDMAEHSEDDRYARVKEKVAEKGVDNPMVVKWLTAMAAQNKDNVSIENFQKVFDYTILTMTKIQKDLTKGGSIKITKENTAELIRPHILNKLREAAAEKGLEISEEQEQLFKEYEEFHGKYMEKLNEQKKQIFKNGNNIAITPSKIEKKSFATETKISGINEQTQGIREDYLSQTKENGEVGIENEHDGM